MKDNVEQFKELTESLAELYERKNHDYGNSFENNLDEFGLLPALIRLKEKYDRFRTLSTTKAAVDDENIEDTLMDMASYCIMTAMWVRKVGDNRKRIIIE